MPVPPRISRTYLLTAGESNAEGLMPLTLLAERIIEIATIHANALGIGYAALIEKNIGWVLSRLSIEMKRYPRINEKYTLSTWIESYTRRFSERNFEISTPEGEILGYARSVWAPMDFAKRTAADLDLFNNDEIHPLDDNCGMAKAARVGVLPENAEDEEYSFRFCDLDFNRHVNTVRYIELILNHWSLDHYDRNCVGRIDLFFHHECRFGERISLRVANENGSGRDLCEIVAPDGTRAIGAAITWRALSSVDYIK